MSRQKNGAKMLSGEVWGVGGMKKPRKSVRLDNIIPFFRVPERGYLNKLKHQLEEFGCWKMSFFCPHIHTFTRGPGKKCVIFQSPSSLLTL